MFLEAVCNYDFILFNIIISWLVCFDNIDSFISVIIPKELESHIPKPVASSVVTVAPFRSKYTRCSS